MQVNLRKAQKLRRAIETAISASSISTSIGIDVDDTASAADPISKVDLARGDLRVQYKNQLALSGILARLRTSIARANLDAGIDEMLAQMADIDRNIKIITPLSTPARETSDSVLTKIKRIQASLSRSDEDIRGSHRPQSSVVNVSLVDQAMADEVAKDITELRRAREELDERRLTVNFNAKIQIGDDDAKLLRELNIV
jgi:hypothetical protein